MVTQNVPPHGDPASSSMSIGKVFLNRCDLVAMFKTHVAGATA